MKLNFEKWHGCSNDFIVTWVDEKSTEIVLASLQEQAPNLCDRRTGIGADGLLVLHTSLQNDAKQTPNYFVKPDVLTIINRDGSVARNCGNGLRCAANSVWRRRQDLPGGTRDSAEPLNLSVEGEPKTCRYRIVSSGSGIPSRLPLVTVAMGNAKINDSVAWFGDVKSAVLAIAQDQGHDHIDSVEVCDLGNPHVIIRTPAASRRLLLQYGPLLQAAGSWDGINVHLVSQHPWQEAKASVVSERQAAEQANLHLSDDYYQTYIWERGVGETMACGSGACAVVATGSTTDLLDSGRLVAVKQPGGLLFVEYDHSSGSVQLTGPAIHIYDGVFTL